MKKASSTLRLQATLSIADWPQRRIAEAIELPWLLIKNTAAHCAFIVRRRRQMPEMPSPIPLIILDVQDAIDQPIWNGKSHPGYLSVIQRLLQFWRSNGWPVLHVKHDEKTPTSSYYAHGPWNGIKQEVAPIKGEAIIIKHENCAFIGTQLDAALKGMNAHRIVLTGVVIADFGAP
jgi:isochorismate hydrolase